MGYTVFIYIYDYMWVNLNNSLTWNLRSFGDSHPYTSSFPVRSRWGREKKCNLAVPPISGQILAPVDSPISTYMGLPQEAKKQQQGIPKNLWWHWKQIWSNAPVTFPIICWFWVKPPLLVEVYLYICQCFSFFSDYPPVIKRQSKIPNL